MRNGPSKVWEQLFDPHVNKNRVGLTFSVKNNKGEIMKLKSALGKYQDIFHRKVIFIQIFLRSMLFWKLN